MITENAKISSTFLGVEDHGIFTVWLTLEFDGSGQGFGGWALDEPIKDEEGKFLKREGTKFGMIFIEEVLNACGVEQWEDLKGTLVRIQREDGWNSKIEAIGHITKKKWFFPRDLAQRFKDE